MSATVFDEEEASNLVAEQFVLLNDRANLPDTTHLEHQSRGVKHGYGSTSVHDTSNPSGSREFDRLSGMTFEDEDAIEDSPEESDEDDEDEEDNNPNDKSTLKREFQHLSWRHRPSYKLLRIALLLQIIGQMSAVTSLLDAIVYLVCQHHFKNTEPQGHIPEFSPISPTPFWTSDSGQSFQDPRCFAPEITALVGIFQTYMTTLTAILGVLTVPFLASCSDRLGRKPILLWTMTCTILSLLITITCCVFPDKVDYKLFLVSSVLDGVGGSMSIMVILCSSYTSDCVKEHYRAGALSVLDACVFGGIAVGPFIGSFILSYTDHNLILLFSISLFLQLLSIFIVLFVLPESRSERARSKSQSEHMVRKNSFLNERLRRQSSMALDASMSLESYNKRWSLDCFVEKIREIIHSANILGPLKALNFSHIRESRARFNAFVLILAQATLSEVIMASMPLIFLYAKTRFSWTSVENGYFISLLGTSRFVVLSTLLPFVLNIARSRWSHSTTRVDVVDKRLLLGGLLCSIVGYFLLAEAPTGSAFMFSVTILALGSGSSPLLRNAIIKHSPKNKVGEVLGAATLIARLENIFMPAIFATVYTYTVKHRAQAIIEIIMATEFAVFLLLSCMYLDTDKIEDVEDLVNRT